MLQLQGFGAHARTIQASGFRVQGFFPFYVGSGLVLGRTLGLVLSRTPSDEVLGSRMVGMKHSKLAEHPP